MDSLDSFDTSLDTSEEGVSGTLNSSKEAVKEQSEKQQEKASKALAGIKRSRKDEAKSKRHSQYLAKAIGILLDTPGQDKVLASALALLEKEVPSHATLSLLLLASPEALSYMLTELHQAERVPPLPVRSTPQMFSDQILTEAEKVYVNTWLAVVFSLLSDEASTVMTQKFSKQLRSELREEILVHTREFFLGFLSRVGITGAKSVDAYVQFIISQIEKRISLLVLEDVDTGGRARL